MKHNRKLMTYSKQLSTLLTAAAAGDPFDVKSIVEIKKPSVKKVIEALELLGAALYNLKGYPMLAMCYWREAIKLRNISLEIDVLMREETYIGSYLTVNEITSISELDQLLYDDHDFYLKTLVVAERILGPNSQYLSSYIKKQTTRYVKEREFLKCVPVWMALLHAQQWTSGLINTSIIDTFSQLCVLFSHVIHEIMSGIDIDAGSVFENVLEVFQWSCTHLRKIVEITSNISPHPRKFMIHHILEVSMHLIKFLCALKNQVPEEKHLEMKTAVRNLINMQLKNGSGWTMLHFACYKYDFYSDMHETFNHPSLEVVNLLLEEGASPNVSTLYGDTPLHFAASTKPFYFDIFHSLISFGAYLNDRNNKSLTAFDLLGNLVPFYSQSFSFYEMNAFINSLKKLARPETSDGW